MAQVLPYNSKSYSANKIEGDETQSWCRMRYWADHNKKSWKYRKLTKKCGPGRTPGLGYKSEESRRFMNESNSEALSPSSASGYVGHLRGCVRLWSSTFFLSFCNNLLYYIDVCFWNDRKTPPSQDAMPVSLELLLDLMKSFQLIRWVLVKSRICH